MTADDFRRMALSFPESAERTHMRHPDFRVRGKIFATLGYPDERWGMVKLTPEQQQEFVQSESVVFVPVKGGWGRLGATRVFLKAARKAILRRALATAWRNAAPKGLVQKFETKAHNVAPSGKGRRSLKGILDSLSAVRMKLPKGMTVKDLIEEGRRF